LYIRVDSSTLSFCWGPAREREDKAGFSGVDEVVQAAVREAVAPIVAGMGFALVEARHNRSHRQNHVSVVVYRPQGVGIEDCALISRTLYPRLELIEGLEDLRLEVSSPGLDRVIKGFEEFEIFKGRGVRVLRVGSDDFLRGIIDEVKGDTLVVNRRGERIEIRQAEIRKARLDSAEEVTE
jgi:ribosome maturation factor RimP